MRNLLGGGGLVTLTALPSRWVEPVVDAVVLPTHAQTSPDDDEGSDDGEAGSGFNVVISETRAPGWLDRLIRTAYASEPRTVPSGFLCIESTGEESYRASYAFGSLVARNTGSFGDCVPLTCGAETGLDLVVTGKNGDGTFDFELHPLGEGCALSAVVSAATDTSCNVRAEECPVAKEEE